MTAARNESGGAGGLPTDSEGSPDSTVEERLVFTGGRIQLRFDFCRGLAQNSRRIQVESVRGPFFIGMTKLSEGDRAGAQVHFRKAVETRVFAYFDYTWSKSFLARMDQDPNWPLRIQVKK